MLIQVTLQELMLFIASALGIAAGIFLLSILWNIKKVVSVIRPLVEANKEIINKTIKTMPGIFDNVDQISSNLRDTTDKLKASVPIILQEVEFTTNAAKGSIEMAGVVIGNMGSGIIEAVATYKKEKPGFMDYFHSIEEILQILYRTFSSNK